MTLDLLHADAVDRRRAGGSGGHGRDREHLPRHAGLPRTRAAQYRGIDRPNVIKPETAHPAFDKACHLFGIELKVAPVDPVTTQVDTDWVDRNIDADTVAIIGSACNYGYGTIDPIESHSPRSHSSHGVGLHVDSCLGGFILPFGQELGYDIPVFDYRLPGCDLHLGGHPQVRLRPQGDLGAHLPGQGAAQRPVLLPSPTGAGASTALRAWRAPGRVGCWPPPGRPWSSSAEQGYRHYAQEIFETAAAMQESVRATPSCVSSGNPTFLFSFTSDEFDIYHVNDFMRQRGWRFNGQQYPNALHMAVTRPQTQPGVAEAFAADLAEAVGYAARARRRSAQVGGYLRGCRRRDDRRGGRVHQDGHERHAGQPASHPRRRLTVGTADEPTPCPR